MPGLRLLLMASMLLLGYAVAGAGQANRLAYVDDPCNPFYPAPDTAKLTTPQWVGEPGVEAVIVLSCDDLSDPQRHETYLRPILERLAKINGRAPVSLFATKVDPQHPQLQQWLRQGVSIEAHTFSHPCPILQASDLAQRKADYDRCLDLLSGIPGNKPVAFRTPCCDSMTSAGPRLFTEIICKSTAQGNFVAIDSSVMTLFTAADPALPRQLVLDADGRHRFRKYLPRGRTLGNVIENYPYPYVVDGCCWQLPVTMPSDWQAQHLNGPGSAVSVADWKAAVDATVLKQGVMVLCFHPYAWIGNHQIVEIVDYAATRYGSKVRFLNFPEVHHRLVDNLLGGRPLRDAKGKPGGVRVLDIDGDGYMDVATKHGQQWRASIWLPQQRKWRHCELAALDSPAAKLAAAVVRLADPDNRARAADHPPPLLRDVDGDGVCELVTNDSIYWCSSEGSRWLQLTSKDDHADKVGAVWLDVVRDIFRPTAVVAFPVGLCRMEKTADGRWKDKGLRLVDVDGDCRLDLIVSNPERAALFLFTPQTSPPWRRIFDAKPTELPEHQRLPPFVRADGTNNGAWFAARTLWVQNEDTGGRLPQHVFARPLADLLPPEDKPSVP